jgi:peptidoglycan hydrolase CwlO-like protein
MIKWIKSKFCCGQVEDLQKEILILKNKISEKQEQINKTNAHYKRIIREIKSKNKKPL